MNTKNLTRAFTLANNLCCKVPTDISALLYTTESSKENIE